MNQGKRLAVAGRRGAGSNEYERTHPWVDRSRAPLYVVTYPKERTELDLLKAHEAIAAVYQGGQGPLAWIVDATQVSGGTPKERSIVAAHEKRVADLAQRRCVGLGIVIPNALARGLYTAIRWIAPARYPCELFASYDEAERWVRQRLSEAGG